MKNLVPIRWQIVFLLFLSYVVWYMDRVNISIAGPVMMKHFNWSAAEYGMVSSAFFVGYALTQIPGGWMADRFGGSKVILFGTIWWSVFVFITPWGATLPLMLLIRCLMGTGEGVNAPCHVSLSARWMPKKEQARAAGLYYLGMPLGITITMPLTVWIIEEWGWPMAFYSFAFIGVAWCALWWWMGRDKPEQHPWISKEELAYIKSDQDPPEVMDQPTDWKAIFSNASVWGLAMTYFFYNYVWYLFMSWLPAYLVMSRGFSLVKTGIYAMLPYIVCLFTMTFGGWLSDTLTKKYGPAIGRRIPPTIGFSGCALFMILATNTPNAYYAVGYISASIGFLTIGQGSFWSMPIDLSSKDGGVISGFMNTSGTIAGVFAPTITGFIITLYNNNFQYALYFGAAMAMMGVLVIWSLCKVKPIFAKTAPAAETIAK